MSESEDLGIALDADAERVLAALERAGVRHYELHGYASREVEVQVEDGALSAVNLHHERSFGLRVLDRGLGFVPITARGLSPLELDALVAQALALARLGRPSALVEFPGPAIGPQTGPYYEPRASGRLRPHLAEIARAIEARALAHRHVARVRPAVVSETVGLDAFWTSGGRTAREWASRAEAGAGIIAEDGADSQSMNGSATARVAEDLNYAEGIDRAIAISGRLLGARSFRTGRVPVLFAPEVVSELLELLIAALAGDRLERGTSFFDAHALGTRLLAETITVVDRPHDPVAFGAAGLDGEGLLTRDALLFERGVWREVLDDRESAARSGRVPGGHALRAVGSPPAPGAHAPALLPGETSEAELLERSEGGLYVLELTGLHNCNEWTGEFSVGALGFAIRGGQLAEPVAGVTLLATIPDLFRGTAVPTRDTLLLEGTRVPGLWVEALDVAG